MPVTTKVECALPGCNQTITHSPKDRRKREYCSNACRQKAYRLRHRLTRERNEKSVTISSYEQMLPLLDSLTTDQLEALQSQIAVRLNQQRPEPTTSFLYFRKGSGVIHLAVSQNVSICGRGTKEMKEVQPNEGHRICHTCAKLRDKGTWWDGWRDLFSDGSDDTKS